LEFSNFSALWHASGNRMQTSLACQLLGQDFGNWSINIRFIMSPYAPAELQCGLITLTYIIAMKSKGKCHLYLS